MKKLQGVKMLLLTAAVVAGILCANADTDTGKPVLRIGYLPVLTHLPVLVSYENDRLNSSYEMRISRFNTDTAIEAALRVGALDVACISAPIPFCMQADGVPVKVLGTCHSGGARLLAHDAKGLQELKGMIIGVPGLDSSENIRLHNVCRENDLRLGLDLKPVTVSFRSVVADLSGGRLDAIYLPEPLGSMAEADEVAHEIAPQDAFSGILASVLVVREEFIKEHPEIIKEWLSSIVRACHFLENDIDQGARQTVIFQSKYLKYPDVVVESSLLERKGGLRFDSFIPDDKQIRDCRDTAQMLQLFTTSVRISDVVDLSLMKSVLAQVGEPKVRE